MCLYPEPLIIRGKQVITLGINRTEKTPPPRKKSQFDAVLRMCEQMAVFMQEHNADKFKAYFTRDSGMIGLYLVTTNEAYDFDLSDKLADFASPYIERGLLNSVMLLPASTPDELTAYFDPRTAIRVEIEESEIRHA